MTGGDLESAYQIARAQAALDGAIEEILVRHWFEASWELCAAMIGATGAGGDVTEPVEVGPRGTVRLSQRPTGPVRLFSCGQLVATLPPGSLLLAGTPSLPNPYKGFGEGWGNWLLTCSTSLCCYCDLTAVYSTRSRDPCAVLPATFVQAVARLFTYICENRGDVEMDESIISKSGAKAFLAPQLTYVL